MSGGKVGGDYYYYNIENSFRWSIYGSDKDTYGKDDARGYGGSMIGCTAKEVALSYIQKAPDADVNKMRDENGKSFIKAYTKLDSFYKEWMVFPTDDKLDSKYRQLITLFRRKDKQENLKQKQADAEMAVKAEASLRALISGAPSGEPTAAGATEFKRHHDMQLA